MANIPGFESGFDANVTIPTSNDPIPPGDYTVQLVKSESKQTKDGTGHYLSLTFKVIEGDYENRIIFTNLNMVNKNLTAEEIARRLFSSLCHAANVLTPNDTQELHGIPVIAKVKIQKGNESYPDRNDIASFKSLDSDETSAPW